MRATTAFKRLMDLPGVTVTDVDFQPTEVVVAVKLRSRKLHCPACGFTTKARYDTRPVASSWRHLDLGQWRLEEVRANLRRIDCCPWRSSRGGSLRPVWLPAHLRLRGPGRVVGDHHGQDGPLPAGAHRLGHRRADHRRGDGDRTRSQASRQPLRRWR